MLAYHGEVVMMVRGNLLLMVRGNLTQIFINRKDAEERFGRHKRPQLNPKFVVTVEMQQEFLAVRLSVRNRNMTR